jgi:hypothetical protein
MIESLGPSLRRTTQLGVLFWGCVKEQIFRSRVGIVVERRAQTSNTIAYVPSQTLGRKWRHIEYRLDILRATNGTHSGLH